MELDKKAIILILEQGYSIDQAWKALKPEYFELDIAEIAGKKEEAKEHFRDTLEQNKIKYNFIKRINRKIGQNRL